MRELIIKYLEEKADSNEQLALLNWLQDKDNQLQFGQIKSEWENKRLNEDIAPEHWMGWANLQSKLLQQAENIQNIQLQLNKFFRYAAILVVLLAIPVFWYLLQRGNPESYISYTKVSADKGQVTKVVLPDGSEVWLNDGSSIQYDALFSKENRNIELEGEAFFNAAKNKNLPMIVFCSQLRVKVVGTRFNVLSYSENGNIQVTLEEGAVMLYESSHPQTIRKMEPGEMATYSKTNQQIDIVAVNTELFTSWKDGVMNINSLSLEELVPKLERRYHQKFEIDEAAKSLRYTLTIKNESLHQVLELLKIINPVDAVQKHDVIYLKYNPQRAKEMNHDK